MKKNTCLRILFWYFCGLLLDVHPVMGQSYLQFENFQYEQGFAPQRIEHILQDNRGYLWFCSKDGLNKFDGISVKIFRTATDSIINNWTKTIFQDRDGYIWIGTSRGLSRWDYKTREVKNFLPDKTNKDPEANDIYAIAQDTFGAIWIGTVSDGLFRLDKNHGKTSTSSDEYNFVHFKYDSANEHSISNNTVWSIYFDHHGNGWVGTQDGLNYFDAGQLKKAAINFTHILHSNTNVSSPAAKRVFKIIPDQHQNLWLVSHFDTDSDPELDRIDSSWVNHPVGTVSIHHYLPLILKSAHLPSFNPYSMLIDSKNQLWIGTFDKGLFKCSLSDLESDHLTHIDHYANDSSDAYSLADNWVTDIYEDRQHIIWFGTQNGVSKWVPSHKFFNQKDFPKKFPAFWNNSVSDMEEDADGNCWLANNDSLGLFDGIRYRTIKIIFPPKTYDPQKPVDIARLLFLKDGELCIGTSRNGIFFIDKNQLQQLLAGKSETLHAFPGLFDIAPKKPYPIITSLWTDRSGNIFAGTTKGVWSFNSVTKRATIIYSLPQNNKGLDLSFNIKDGVCTPNGMIWIGTDIGLKTIDPISKKIILTRGRNPADSIIKMDGIQCMLADSKSPVIWIGTANGLSRFNYENGIVENLSSKNDMGNYFINSIEEDNDGNIWMGTNGGLLKYNSAQKKFSRYNSHDGLKSDEFIYKCAFKNPKDLLYFGTKRGIVTFFPDSIRDNRTLPPVYISDFKIHNQSVLDERDSSLVRQFEIEKHLVLSYNQNYFSFDFVALNFINPAQNQFQYTLENFDKKWDTLGNRAPVNYTNIPPGDYTFKVKASNNSGVWNEAPTTLALHIDPPWYETWWFRILLGLAGISMIISANILYTQYKLREQRMAFEKQQAIDRERSRIAGEMHDDLGSGLAAIRLISEMAKRKSTADELKNEIGKISESSSDLIQNMREIIWAMSSKNDKLESLIAYIRKYAFEFLENAGIDCSVKMPDDIVDCDLAGEVRRNIFLVVKESLHNIVKHAGASRVEIGMQVHDDFAIIIHDNGKGIDTEKMNQFGNGLKNMSDRMVSVGGRFEISSKEGTTINLSLPLQD